MERDKEGRPQTGEELGVGLGALREGPELPEVGPGKERDEDAGELPQHEPRVAAGLEPPPRPPTAAGTTGRVQGGSWSPPPPPPRGRRRGFYPAAPPPAPYSWRP